MYPLAKPKSRTVFGTPLLAHFLLLLTLSGCAALQKAGAPSPAERAKAIDSLFEAADFSIKSAETPAEKDYLESIAPLELRYALDDKGEFHFWLADPYNCRCIFTGDETAYLRYAKLQQEAEWSEGEEREAEGLVATRRQAEACLGLNIAYPSKLSCTQF